MIIMLGIGLVKFLEIGSIRVPVTSNIIAKNKYMNPKCNIN